MTYFYVRNQNGFGKALGLGHLCCSSYVKPNMGKLPKVILSDYANFFFLSVFVMKPTDK